MLLFDGFVAAEAFRMVEDLDYEWELIEHTPQETARMLETCAGMGIPYVRLNCPTLSRSKVS